MFEHLGSINLTIKCNHLETSNKPDGKMYQTEVNKKEKVRFPNFHINVDSKIPLMTFRIMIKNRLVTDSICLEASMLSSV